MMSILVAALLAFGTVVSIQAQVPAAHPISLGTHSDAATKTVYSIASTGQPEQNLQEIQFRIVTASKTSVVTLRTGRQKTVGQVTALVGDVFTKYLAGQPANTPLGSLGNLKKGGEVVFVAESSEKLRFDFSTPEVPPSSSVFNRADAAAFAAILGR